MSIQGLCCANFSIAADVTLEGGIARSLLINPASIGQWLEQKPGGILSCEVDGVSVRDTDWSDRRVVRSWPLSCVELADERFNDVSFALRVFAPCRIDDAVRSSLPALLLHCDIQNAGNGDREARVSFESETLRLVGPAAAVVPAGGTCTLRIALVAKYDERAVYATELRDPAAVDSFLTARFADIESDALAFADALPDCGNPDVNQYLRLETAAAMVLTKVLANGQVLTMGYKELNQRDSYWTSFLHLVHFPSLDRAMIEESAGAQREDGKIPTTILPLIEREDDIDVNEYFVLRVLRHYEYWNDQSLLRKYWTPLCKAIDYLVGRDTDHDGLPEQVSFWGDWKDVKLVEGRVHSPHFCLLWCAVLKKAAAAAAVIGDQRRAAQWGELYAKAFDCINRSPVEGGLWDGSCYRAKWRDNRTDSLVYEDQIVGILFGVVDSHKSARILDTLDANGNRTARGYRESWPGNGVYHEGGIWIFLNCIHALVFCLVGRRDEALRLLSDLGHADLVKDGDWLPHEYLHGVSGAQAGCSVQGWNAAYFAAGAFGLANEGVRNRMF